MHIIGVEPEGANAMAVSLARGERVVLSRVDAFADGVAVKQVGQETFRLCRELVDGVVLVSNAAVSAAIKDVFNETRSILEPAGALAVAGAKAWLKEYGMKGATVVAVTSGANMTFERLRLVADLADVGGRKEATITTTIPERPGAFKYESLPPPTPPTPPLSLGGAPPPRALREFISTALSADPDLSVTEFKYRYSAGSTAQVLWGVGIRSSDQLDALLKRLNDADMTSTDISGLEVAQVHLRHLAGGRGRSYTGRIEAEKILQVVFPERPGALRRFLDVVSPVWNVTLFHYRSSGNRESSVLLGVQVPSYDEKRFQAALSSLRGAGEEGFAFKELPREEVTVWGVDTRIDSEAIIMGCSTASCYQIWRYLNGGPFYRRQTPRPLHQNLNCGTGAVHGRQASYYDDGRTDSKIHLIKIHKVSPQLRRVPNCDMVYRRATSIDKAAERQDSSQGPASHIIVPIVSGADLGFDVDAEVSSAFRMLNAEQAAGLTLRQRLALKAAIQAAATTVPPPGPSSGADSGTSNAAAGLPACKLQLRRDSQNQDLFFFEPMDTNSTAAAVRAGVSSRFFLDPEGRQIDELQKWLGLVEDEHRNGRPIPPLIINGLIKVGYKGLTKVGELLVQLASSTCNMVWSEKSGKSYMLKEVLPAVANTYYSSGRQHAGTVFSEPNFLHVKCLTLDRWSGSSVFLQEFLIKLKRSAADQQLSAAASTPAPSDNSAGAVVDAIQDFMWRLPRDRLNFLLIDEAQSFYLLERSMWDDFSGDGFSPRGSTLDMDEVQLMRRIFKKLLLDSPHWVAWAITGSGMATLWANIAATPVLIDLRMALQVPTDPRMVVPVLGQPTSQVLLLRELLDPMAGVERAKLPPAFEALLSSFTTERNGRLYLDNLLFAQVLQAATTESGELLEEIIAIPSFSSTMFRELVVLGECCKDENFDSYEDLHSLLEAMASALALTPDKLLKADWFIQPQPLHPDPCLLVDYTVGC
ncbi:hypothetical protein VOLCADRAFT_89774 [Volvox carteri f. nagariensis]|uniref:threonine ammonia-lyase n=1 Tax=Volvox carteri f. nagariensis TaxID=3068 RepID=D8TSL4_VOLCA|nr:uncharacterized protein VOLCADRAFT_89774 [Volvox carteri f. nagariensis]EFJ49507.1 hypothetical protein VOLCADRAFT_89774 [Volvox carteri f. nagariensis]|eukprot:XP_002949488.1 hypothetical protein VOLCADRAFT_89774 [Volvox carteri f. nagariensis]